MKSFIQKLPASVEFFLVLLICYTLIFYADFEAIISQLNGNAQLYVFSDARLLHMTVFQVLSLAIVLWNGHIRGWTIATFGFQINWKWTGIGLLLFVYMIMLNYFFRLFLYYIHLHPDKPLVTSSGLTLPVVILVSVTNPIWEEVLQSGYFIYSLQRFGMWPAILFSAIFRGLLHGYQGFFPAMAILLLGIVFAFFYWRWRQLWPLIVAHG